MTDIYLSASREGRGCLPRILLLLVLGGLLFLGLRHCRSASTPDAPHRHTDTPPRGTPPAPGTAQAPDLSHAQNLVSARNWTAAREELMSLLDATPDPAARRPVEDLLGRVHTEMVFSFAPMPEKVEHLVQRGDILSTLASRHNTTVSLIAHANGLHDPDRVPLRKRLRILHARFSVLVDKSDNELVVRMNDRFFKRYRVGTGTHNGTPAGAFVLEERIAEPIWYHPSDNRAIPYGDPANLLGTHYLKLNTPGIGIHGTWEPETIGSQSSAGCVRLLNAEIKELYMLLPIGTPVEIVD